MYVSLCISKSRNGNEMEVWADERRQAVIGGVAKPIHSAQQPAHLSAALAILFLK
jgi:hypothetical protein